jgi:hypothetical protein
VFCSGLRIRIHFIRIQGFNDQNWKEITAEKKKILSKTTIYLSLGLHKECPSYRRSLQLSKEAIQHFKTWTLKKKSTFVGHFCPLDPDSESESTDPIESGSDPDPDPQPWFCYLTFVPEVRRRPRDRHTAIVAMDALFVGAKNSQYWWVSIQNTHPFSTVREWISFNLLQSAGFLAVLWIRILMDPHSFGCPGSRSGSVLAMRIRPQEHGNWPKFTNIPVFLPFKKAFVPSFRNRRYDFWAITYFNYIFHVKIQIFVILQSDQDPDPHDWLPGSGSPHWDKSWIRPMQIHKADFETLDRSIFFRDLTFGP